MSEEKLLKQIYSRNFTSIHKNIAIIAINFGYYLKVNFHPQTAFQGKKLTFIKDFYALSETIVQVNLN